MAYELYEKSGRAIGRDMENWLEAERTVTARYSKKEIPTAAKKPGQMAEAPAKVEKIGHHGHRHHHGKKGL